MALELVATCALGLEELLASELEALGLENPVRLRGAVEASGSWRSVWRANLWLRTANRVLVRLRWWPAADEAALARGARELVGRRDVAWNGVPVGKLFHPDRTFSIRATSSASRIKDARWIALKVKDGLADGQRERWRRRSSIDRQQPDLPLRVWLHRDRATLLLDTSGLPLDRRGYRLSPGGAPLRETLAAGCVLAGLADPPEGWSPRRVVDPMCGTGTLLAEAGLALLGRRPAPTREEWAFERLPGFDRAAFAAFAEMPGEPLVPDIALFGADYDRGVLRGAAQNLERAGLADRSTLTPADAFAYEPPGGAGHRPGLLLLNPPYGERLSATAEQWRRIGDLFKQRYAGWRAVVITGDPDRGKQIGLRPGRRLPVKNGPIDARILVFDLY